MAFYGALGEIRTHDLRLRRATLYPAELQAQRPVLYPKSLKKSRNYLLENSFLMRAAMSLAGLIDCVFLGVFPPTGAATPAVYKL